MNNNKNFKKLKIKILGKKKKINWLLKNRPERKAIESYIANSQQATGME